jgi:hypothetical protein
MADARPDLPQGTLDLLILTALSLAPLHGWGVSARLRQISRSRWAQLVAAVGLVLKAS